MTASLEQRRDTALAHYRAGRFRDAVTAQIEIVNAIGPNNAESADDQMRLAAFLFATGDHAATAKVMQLVVSHRPDDARALSNYGTALSRIGKTAEAAKVQLKAVELAPDLINVRDALCSVLSRLGRHDEARVHGIKSLVLKDRTACATGKAHRVPAKPPQFDAGNRKRNIIAFSLWGADARYCDGAIENAARASAIYPHWTCRFYVDETVPSTVRDKLSASGSELVMMKRTRPFDGLFWRFLPINDGSTRHFLVRDADAIINTREKAAVEAWLASGKAFHVMRDWWTHTELVLAGMWGGTGGVLPPLQTLLKEFKPASLANWHVDQWFLRSCVWPTLKQSCLIHDSHFDALGALPYPEGSELPPGHHVGQDASAVRADSK